MHLVKNFRDCEIMKVKCPQCLKTINIKEGSYPKERSFSFACPGCGFKIKVDPLAEIKPEEPEFLYGEDLKKKILENNSALPSVPEILVKIKEILDDPRYSAKDVSTIISLDQAIAARVLKLANSAYFNFNPPIPTIEEACILLGEKNLISIVLVAGMSKMLGKKLEGYNIPSGSLFYHSIAAAIAADLIARDKMPLFELDAFSAGLLHDCGKIVLGEYVSKRKKEFTKVIREENINFYEAETMIFGFSHADIGYKLLESWDIPEIQTHAIGFHHHPWHSDGNELAYILNLADYLAIKSGFSASVNISSVDVHISNEVLGFLDVSELELEEYREIIKKTVKEMTKGITFK